MHTPDLSSLRNERLSKSKSKTNDQRTAGQRDRDRILYSSAFRRLAEVTQVVSANSGYVFHNRLTHSLQVAQVARRLAEKLLRDNPALPSNFEGLDPDVAEAAALAHDLGHPPFGHVIEECLNKLSSGFGGFEGNAQSFRIVTKLAFHADPYPGLNLSRATLCAILKYPWLKDRNLSKPRKWGAYESEKENLDFARKLYPYEFDQSTEAYLMDLADDITYCVHDLEDFYRAGRIPLHLLAATQSKEVDYFFGDMLARQQALGDKSVLDRADDLRQLFKELLFVTFPSMQAYRGSKEQRVHLRSFTGSLIGRYINAVSLTTQSGRTRPYIQAQFRDELFMLKQLTWTYVIQAPALATQQLGQQNMVKTLFEAYSNAASEPSEWKLFPVYYQERLQNCDSEHERLRTCVDLIAGMTEIQVHRLYARISGASSEPSLVDPFM